VGSPVGREAGLVLVLRMIVERHLDRAQQLFDSEKVPEFRLPARGRATPKSTTPDGSSITESM
jgi:hypothetical protein